MKAFLDRVFRIGERGSDPRREVLGGITTFAAMAYIIVVNPAILKHAGLPEGPSTIATILAAVFGTLVMALYANRPFAVAPYMGENVFIAFVIVAGLHITVAQRLGAVFVSGVAFLLLTLAGVRHWLARAVSPSMKYSFAAGIGLFLLLLGMEQTGMVKSWFAGKPASQEIVRLDADQKIARPPVPLALGDFQDARVQVAAAAFCLTAVLMYWCVPGSILIGMLAAGVAGWVLGMGDTPEAIAALPWEEDLSEIAFTLDIAGVLQWAFLPILLTLFLVSFLDTLGTLVALGAAGDMLDEKGNLPDMQRPMLVDSLACMFSAVVGTSTSGAYIESAAGIRDGARTGLAALVTASLFALALFFVPLVKPLQSLTFAYGPALMVVGVLMLGACRRIDFDDMTEAVPAVVTMALMPFTYNVANGLTAGLALYLLLKLAAGRGRELHPGAWLLGFLCLLYFVWGLPH